jgi:hypothetical protein
MHKSLLLEHCGCNSWYVHGSIRTYIFLSGSPNTCIGCPLGTNIYSRWIVGMSCGTGDPLKWDVSEC